jgi:hypothetical protein
MNTIFSRSHWGSVLFLLLSPILLSAQVQIVKASQKGGKFVAPFTVSLQTATLNADIRYTLDGNEPDSLTSPQYSTPISIGKTTTLRAKAFAAGQVSSKITTHTYLFNMPHTFPIVAVSFKPDDFFDPTKGIYPNYLLDLEVPAHLELFENGRDTASLDQDLGTVIQGKASATLPQKSLEFRPKTAYGLTNLPYKIFPNLPYTSYKRMVIRNSGQDWNNTMFRDDYVTSLHADLTDLGGVLKKPEIYSSASRPSVVYYNGQYWGIHSLKERMKSTFVEQHFNLKGSEYDMVENEFKTLNGDSTVWIKFQTYLGSGINFSENANYDSLKAKIDIQNFMDIMAFNVFVDHEDWPANNNRRFLAKAVGSKWKWISWDYDFTMGMFQATGGFNTGDPSPTALRRLIDPTYQFFNNAPWATLLFRKCMENAQFRRDFSNRLADMMNTIFKPARLNQRLTNYQNLYADEIVRHSDRWGNPNAIIFPQNIAKIKNFNDNRAAYVYREVDSLLTDVTGIADVHLNVSPIGAGKLQFSTLNLGNLDLPYLGKYFTGIDIPVVATATPGYVFSRWSDASLPAVNTINVRLTESKTLIAIFVPEGEGPCVKDTLAPLISNCPAAISVQTTANCAVATWTAPTVVDNCSTPSVSSNFVSGTCFPEGTTTVTYTAKDTSKNQSTCSFNVVVTKTVVVEVCKTYSGGNVNNVCGCAANLYAPYAIRFEPLAGSPDCKGTLIQLGNGRIIFDQKANGTARFQGTFRTASWQLITLDATLSGGTSTPPVGAPVKAFCMANQTATDWFYYTAMTGTYQEGANTPLPISLAGSPFQVGVGASQQSKIDLGASMRFMVNNDTSRVAWLNIKLLNETIVACAGGVNPCETDTIAPVLKNCPINQTLTTISTCANATWLPPTASDNCGTPSLIQTAGAVSGTCFSLGANTVTYKATDVKNNSITCSFTINVTQTNICATETVPPIFTKCPVFQTLTTTTTCANATWLAPAATDNCSAPAIIQTVGLSNGSCFPIGTNAVNFRATDANGNSANCAFNIIVQSAVVDGSQDLGLTISSNNASYSKFKSNIFTLTARNTGASAFSNVVIKFPFPTGANTGGSAVASLGTWREWQAGQRIFEWQIPNFPANSTATLTVPLFFLDLVQNSTVFMATLTTSTPTDINTPNNTASLTLGLLGAPVIVNLSAKKPTQLIPVVIQRIAPNPTDSDIFIDLESIIEGSVIFDISNTLGKLVRSETVSVKKGDNRIFFEANTLQSGLYFISPRTQLAKNVPTKFLKL